MAVIRFGLGMGCCAVALMLAGCQPAKTETPKAAAPPQVIVAPVVEQPIRLSHDYIGKVVAFEKVELRARVTGVLVERAFAEGSDVKKGGLLFRIESDQYEARLASARAKVAGAQANLLRANQELARARQLGSTGVSSQAILDSRIATQAQAQAELLQAQAEVRTAEIDLDYTTITAPTDGRVGQATYSVGNLVKPDSDPLVLLVKMDPIHVKFSLSDKDLLHLEKHEPDTEYVPTLRLADDTIYEAPGRFDFINNTIDAKTGTITVRAVFPNPKGLLIPDQFVTVIVHNDRPVTTRLVPQAAVREDQAGRYVLVVGAGDRVELRRIVIGSQVGTDWTVKDGLAVGDKVIVSGLQKVRPGMIVKPSAGG